MILTIKVKKICEVAQIVLLLHSVFHSIRFKVNKVGTQRSPIFFALKRNTETPEDAYNWKNPNIFGFSLA